MTVWPVSRGSYGHMVAKYPLLHNRMGFPSGSAKHGTADAPPNPMIVVWFGLAFFWGLKVAVGPTDFGCGLSLS